MATKNMYILRGNAAEAGTYPDEQGNKIAWPIGALHVHAATVFAQCLGYVAVVLPVQGWPQSQHSPQAKAALKAFHDDDPLETGFYGFSGGGYNVRHVLEYLAENEAQYLYRIRDVVVLGAPNKAGGGSVYEADNYIATAKAQAKHHKGWMDIDWGKIHWDVTFRLNPDRSQMPPGLPKDLETHMFGPEVLLSGWPGCGSP